MSACALCGEARFVAEAIGVCGACLRSGSPKARALAERGHKNLAVAYHGCTFDCLYCQSWQARHPASAKLRSAQEVADAVDPQTSCLVYLGGDPTPQLAHAVATARLALKKARAQQRPLRLCFETNGAMSRPLLKTTIEQPSASSDGVRKQASLSPGARSELGPSAGAGWERAG